MFANLMYTAPQKTLIRIKCTEFIYVQVVHNFILYNQIGPNTNSLYSCTLTMYI